MSGTLKRFLLATAVLAVVSAASAPLIADGSHGHGGGARSGRGDGAVANRGGRDGVTPSRGGGARNHNRPVAGGGNVGDGTLASSGGNFTAGGTLASSSGNFTNGGTLASGVGNFTNGGTLASGQGNFTSGGTLGNGRGNAATGRNLHADRGNFVTGHAGRAYYVPGDGALPGRYVPRDSGGSQAGVARADGFEQAGGVERADRFERAGGVGRAGSVERAGAVGRAGATGAVERTGNVERVASVRPGSRSGFANRSGWEGGYWKGRFWPGVSHRPGVDRFCAVLPGVYSTFWFGGVSYYFANDVYYTWSSREYGYVMTDPPPVTESAPSDGGSGEPESSDSSSVYAYPRNGQSEEQTEADRLDCHQWAVSQTGFDPTNRSSQSQSAGSPADYRRAMITCLDARGYSAN